MSDSGAGGRRLPPRVGFALAATGLGTVALAFILARQFGLGLGQTYLGLMAANFVVSGVFIAMWNPALLGRRARLGKGTKLWDYGWMLAFMAALYLTITTAMEDLQARDFSTDPGLVWLAGALVLIGGFTIVNLSMAVNPFFEKTVRIQSDQGHRTIDDGPYRFVRHPGYVGFSALLLATPPMLASTAVVGPVLLGVLTLVVRTALEDRTLQDELDGYADYAKRVRFRLIPGVW